MASIERQILGVGLDIVLTVGTEHVLQEGLHTRVERVGSRGVDRPRRCGVDVGPNDPGKRIASRDHTGRGWQDGAAILRQGHDLDRSRQMLAQRCNRDRGRIKSDGLREPTRSTRV